MRVYRVFHTVASSVFSQVDMFHAIAAATCGGHHFIYTTVWHENLTVIKFYGLSN